VYTSKQACQVRDAGGNWATDFQYNDVTFTITAPVASVSPTEGPAGTVFTFSWTSCKGPDHRVSEGHILDKSGATVGERFFDPGAYHDGDPATGTATAHADTPPGVYTSKQTCQVRDANGNWVTYSQYNDVTFTITAESTPTPTGPVPSVPSSTGPSAEGTSVTRLPQATGTLPRTGASDVPVFAFAGLTMTVVGVALRRTRPARRKRS
jgi:LPXTG-motif cell wall-anchored protein